MRAAGPAPALSRTSSATRSPKAAAPAAATEKYERATARYEAFTAENIGGGDEGGEGEDGGGWWE